MGRDRAAYMREYRKLKAKAKRAVDAVEESKYIDMTTTPGKITAAFDIVKADMRIRELEEEVRHLKAELARRPAVRELPSYDATLHDFNSRPFTPVPKK